MVLFYSVLAVLAAYLVGSISFAVIVSSVMGLADPRTIGSKNPGATNVLRSGSKAAAVMTLLLDAGKGWLPVILVSRYGAHYGLDANTQAFVGLGTFIGHLWPLFFRFKGGKGVATALGVLVGISPLLGFFTAVTWVIVVLAFRYSSLASLICSVLAPVYYLLGDGPLWYTNRATAVAIVVMCGLVVWRHKANVVQLLRGTEPRLGRRAV